MANLATMRPSAGTKTHRVWEIADTLTRRTGQMARRADVIRKFEDEGGNANTASTQYHHWKSEQTESQVGKPALGSAAGQVAVQVREAGRIVVPAELRAALGIEEGDTLTARVVDGEIHLMPLATAIKRAQALVREFVPAGANLVDELIAERRGEE